MTELVELQSLNLLDLPVYDIINIIKRLNYLDFRDLFYLNKFFYKLCFGKFDKEYIAIFNDVTEKLYEERKLIHVDPKMYKLHINMSFCEFTMQSELTYYNMIRYYWWDNNLNMFQTCIKHALLKGKFFEFRFAITYSSIKDFRFYNEEYFDLFDSKLYSELKKIEILDYLSTIIPIKDYLYYCIEKNQYELSKWYIERGYQVNYQMLRGMLRKNQFKMLDLCASKNIFPSQDDANNASSVLGCEWLLQNLRNTFLPNTHRIALVEGNMAMITWLLLHNVIPEPKVLKEFLTDFKVIKNNQIIAILNLYETFSILPEKYFYHNVSPIVRSWLYGRNLILF